MPGSPTPPLQRAFDRLAEVLDSKDRARRWYEAYLAAHGDRAVLDTANDGQLAWVHRRAAGSDEVLPLPTLRWMRARVGTQPMEGLALADGRQRLTLLYDEEGRIGDRSRDDRFPGRLVELGRVLADADDGFQASIAFLTGLDDGRHGPARVHYPVPAPGGVASAWRQGLLGCRRALFDGRIGDEVRFVVADGLAGTALGVGTTREEALAAYAAEVARAFPTPPGGIATSTDDYDDDGNLLAPGKPPPGFGEVGPPSVTDAPGWEPADEGEEAWRGAPVADVPPTPEVDPITGRVDFGSFVMRGPTPDVPPLPPRPECLPHVLLPLDPLPERAPSQGRWVRLLGEVGVTRHALRIEEAEGFLLVGADLLGLIDPADLGATLDRIDALDPPPAGRAEDEPFVRFRMRQYRWSPDRDRGTGGLAPAAGASGPRYDAGSLDGDALQAMVYRWRKVFRPQG